MVKKERKKRKCTEGMQKKTKEKEIVKRKYKDI